MSLLQKILRPAAYVAKPGNLVTLRYEFSAAAASKSQVFGAGFERETGVVDLDIRGLDGSARLYKCGGMASVHWLLFA